MTVQAQTGRPGSGIVPLALSSIAFLWSLQVILSPDPEILNLKLWPPQDNCGGGATEVGRLRQVESITVKVLAIPWVTPAADSFVMHRVIALVVLGLHKCAAFC